MPMIKKTTAVNKRQILFSTQPYMAVSIKIAADTDGTILAGTPMTGNLENRNVAFVKATTEDTGTKGVYTVQITTPAAVGDIITVEGVNYECAASENVTEKKFAGTTAAEQVTSLLKMVACDDFDVAADTATDKIKFTQKVAETGKLPVVEVADEATMVVGDVATVTEAVTGDSVSNAVGVLVHDVKVEDGVANGTLLIFGFVNLNRLDPTVSIDSAAKKALAARVTFLKDN